MSSTLKIQSITFTIHGGRNVRTRLNRIAEEQRNVHAEERDSVSTIHSPAGRHVCLFVCCVAAFLLMTLSVTPAIYSL